MYYMLMYNESQKKATIKYLQKLKDIRFRVKPEEYQEMQNAAKKAGYSSMRQFFLDAISDKINSIG